MHGIFGTVLLGFAVIVVIGFFLLLLHYSGKRGEDCPGYPYECACCCQAAECMIEIGRKKDDA